MDKDILIALSLIALQFGLIVFPQPFKNAKIESAESHTNQKHWSYEGTTGPAYWGDISSEYALCETGKAQTPINIDAANVISTTTQAFTFDYRPSPLTVVNNGHTIQVNYQPGSFVSFNGTDYQLAQFHFHVPSEHTINGKAWPMNVHFVHKDQANNLLVVEVLFAEGKKNEELAKVFAQLPKENETLTKPEVFIDAAKLLPPDIKYFHYEGSLTTPPCTEGVKWFVMSNPIDVAKSEVDTFKTLFPMNARPVQPINGRVIEAN